MEFNEDQLFDPISPEPEEVTAPEPTEEIQEDTAWHGLGAGTQEFFTASPSDAWAEPEPIHEPIPEPTRSPSRLPPMSGPTPPSPRRTPSPKSGRRSPAASERKFWPPSWLSSWSSAPAP